jgi:hypothetical protein
MFKSQLIKSNKESQTKHTVHTYGAPVFAPDYSATVVVVKMSKCVQTIMSILSKLDIYGCPSLTLNICRLYTPIFSKKARHSTITYAKPSTTTIGLYWQPTHLES